MRLFVPILSPDPIEMNETPSTDQGAERPGESQRRSPGPLRRGAWAVQERVLWKGGDAARAAGASARWRLESAAWSLRSRIVWPLRDSYRSHGPAGRTALAGAAVLLLAGAGTAGAYVATGGSGDSPAPAPRIASANAPRVARVIEPQQAKPAADTHILEGATPTFGPEGDAAKAGGSAADVVPPSPSQAGSGATSAKAPGDSKKGGAVGPAPVKVAHRFADAFVSYEVGKASPKVRRVFRKTASRPLAKSLATRPPRQPASVKVPRARVLNVVPGPRRGASVSVSVSLLRVGATSELRLQLQQYRRKWLVSDVRG